MAEILRRPEAEADLDDIWFHIALDSINNADRMVDLIEQRCRILAENPMMGAADQNLPQTYAASQLALILSSTTR